MISFLFIGMSVLNLYLQAVTTREKEFVITGSAQGTTYTVKYSSLAEQIAKSDIDSVLNVIDSSMSLYKTQSLINQFNNSKEGHSIDRHIFKVVRKSMAINKDTEGLFDITVAPLVEIWGFGSRPSPGIPDSSSIADLLNCVGTRKLSLNRKILAKAQPCIKIDLNGIAQGYSVDILYKFLRAKKIKNFMIELGGEVRIRGRKPTGKGYAILIEGFPSTLSDRSFSKIATFTEGAMTSSGTYQKTRESDQGTISHLIDPRDGYPLKTDLLSVSVYAKDAITADGYDNALMAMGVSDAVKFVAKRKFLEAYFVYQKPDGSIADTMSSGFKRLLVKNKKYE